MNSARAAVRSMLDASVERMSRTEAALYGTPEQRLRDRAGPTLSDGEAIRAIAKMKADFLAAYDTLADGVTMCDHAIHAIQEARKARGLPPLPVPP